MDILSAALRYGMFRQGDRVLVAVSGGADSIAMLHALQSRSEEFGISLHVAHLNHGIRGDAADEDQRFVQDCVASLDIPYTSDWVDVPGESSRLRKGVEETARMLRYKFLETTAARLNAHRIALGHTADDRAESVLLNVIRGAGMQGLSSIPPVRGIIARPLIDTWRSDIEQYLKQHSLAHRTDATNASTDYARNRVRHELIPLLERDYNPQARAALLRLAQVAEMTADFVERAAVQQRGAVVYAGALDAGLLADCAPALIFEIIRQEILRVRGSLADVSLEAVQRVVDALHSGEDFTITLPSGSVYAARRGSRFEIRGKDESRPAAGFESPLLVPGTTQLLEVELELHADVVEEPSVTKLPPAEAIVDAERIRGTLRARNLRPGDRIRPLGMSGTRKLQDILVDRKIPRRQRSRAVVVTDDEKIVWVVGLVVSEDVRVTPATRRAIHLRAEPAR